MPSLETPPNSTPTPSSRPKVRTGRFGELDEHELIHLLDALDDERSRARFRESIYISFLVYLAIAWFLFYGPRVIFHQPRLISPVDVLKERDKQLTYLETPADRLKIKPKSPKAIADQDHVAQTTHPTLDKKTLRQLEAMRKAGAPAPSAPTPAPPQPQQTQQQPQQQQPPPPAPQPQQQAIVEAPKPAPTKPNFGAQQSAGDLVRQAARNAAHDHGSGGDYGQSAPSAHQGLNTGVDILSDTQGVDFGPYLRRILSDIKRNWYPLIPEEAQPPLNKQGETLIRFTISPDGSIAAMNLDGSSHDVAIDKACWGAITSEGKFPPLPAAFKGPNLELRIDFLTNKPIP